MAVLFFNVQTDVIVKFDIVVVKSDIKPFADKNFPRKAESAQNGKQKPKSRCACGDIELNGLIFFDFGSVNGKAAVDF